MQHSPAAYQVKGSSLSSKLDFSREVFGSDAETQLRGYLADHGVPLLLDSEWYPYTVFNDLCTTIAEWHFGGDLHRLVEVGKYSAQRALSTTYAVFAKGRDFPQFLARVSTLHGRFYSHGSMDVELDPEGTSCRIQLREAPEYSEADLHVAAGFYAGAAEACGLRQISWRLERHEHGVDLLLAWGSDGVQANPRSS